MAKHPTSSRVHREEHAPDDAFVASVKRIASWGRENSRALVIFAVIIILAAAVGIYYVNSQRAVESQASSRFNQIQQTIASGNTQLAITDLQSYLDTFGGTDAARPARLILADLLIQQNRPDEAVQALGNLPDDIEDPYGLAAARVLAAAYEVQGKADDAVATYRRIADNARFTYQRREALADAARVRLQNGDPADAARLYQQVVDTFGEDDAARGYYEMWLAQARAQAREGATAAPATATPDTTRPDSAANS